MRKTSHDLVQSALAAHHHAISNECEKSGSLLGKISPVGRNDKPLGFMK